MPKGKGKRAAAPTSFRKDLPLVETHKSVAIIHGNKTSEDIRELLHDINLLQKPEVQTFSRKNDCHPFDDVTTLEYLGSRSGAGLFAFGNHSKKRPHNLILGRFFDGHVLDMMEFGVSNVRPISSFKGSKSGLGSKPAIVFQGDLFDSSTGLFGNLKSILIDFFRGEVTTALDLHGLDHAMVFTAVDESTVLCRTYNCVLLEGAGNKPKAELTEMGPFFDMRIRRTRFASPEMAKEALKTAKIGPKREKNIAFDGLGDRTGRVHVQRQDLATLNVKKAKGLRGKRKREEDGPNREFDEGSKSSEEESHESSAKRQHK